MKTWNDTYCKNCVHFSYEEIEPECYKWICTNLESAMFDGVSQDGQLCECREIRQKTPNGNR